MCLLGLHRGGNLLTAAERFALRWKGFNRGGKVSTAVERFQPQWKGFNRGVKVSTAVERFQPRWKGFNRGGKGLHRGGKVYTAVGSHVLRVGRSRAFQSLDLTPVCHLTCGIYSPQVILMDIPAGEYLVPVDEDLSREEIIRSYFGLGFTYLELIMFLGSRHGIDLSLRHLKRLLKVYGLSRTQNRDSIDTITRLIREELSRSAGTLGYRSIHKRLLQIHHVSIDRETVRLILRELDPTGAEARLQRRIVRRTYEVNGPNYLWHLDGWDKLKPYGFSVHGCIDGFSRKIMWLEVGASNKDPFVVAGHFANTIKRLKGLPNIVRADRGTENVNIERIQSHLRALNTDQRGHLQMSFLYGKSTSNQRIESWWNQLKQQGMQFWRDHFKELVSVGIMDTSDYVNIHCARFCYMDLLRRELDKIKVLWNTHHIRKSRNRLSPCGKPEVIFHFPELYDSRDYLQPLHHEDLSQMAELLTRDIEDCDPTACELFIDIMSEARVHMPTTIKEADDLFVFLLDMVQSMEI